ncbi:MAG: sigma-70 family RNA polymerase sigma factor [Ruminococcaceae bacterium]|nr:sigma-70 family RNA polymerase sigma factor [Oscillospiraceae bacterium]
MDIENTIAQERMEKNRELLILAQAGDEQALEQLVVDNMALVRSVAIKFKDRGTEFEDLVQIGTIGMLKAIRSFEVERGTAFSTYAVPLIVGEIRKHLRDDGPIKVGREYKRMGALLLGERNRIMAQSGKDPSIKELAQRCGISAEDAAIALDAIAPVSSLSETVYDDGGLTLEGTLPDRDSADETERMFDRLALSQAIGQLDPLWRKIVLLRYWRNMTQQQVAAALGLSQVKISREEKKIMARLKELLTGA